MSSFSFDFSKLTNEDRTAFSNYLKSLHDVLYVENIVEYYTKYKHTLNDNSSQFEKAAFKLFVMIQNNASKDDINNYVVELKKVPLTYGEMRSFFG